MALDSLLSSTPPCQDTRRFCPNCRSTMLTEEPKNADLSELQSTSLTGDSVPRRIISDSDAFSRVLTAAISRMSMIAEETMREKKLLTKDKDAMVGIWENVCLMKSTISYLLHEMYDEDRSNSSEAEDRNSPSSEDRVLLCEDDDGDCGESCGSFEDDIVDEQQEGDSDNHGWFFAASKLLPCKSRAFNSCTDSELTECDSLSRNEGNEDDDDDDGDSNHFVVVVSEDDIKEKERAILKISRGLIGGIATMSIIAKDTSETKKALLAEDKEALAEMLNIVRMVKLLI